MGFDDGAVMIKIGREEPVASMDASGKIIWARHNEIQTVNIKSLGAEFDEARLSHTVAAFAGPGTSRMPPMRHFRWQVIVSFIASRMPPVCTQKVSRAMRRFCPGFSENPRLFQSP